VEGCLRGVLNDFLWILLMFFAWRCKGSLHLFLISNDEMQDLSTNVIS